MSHPIEILLVEDNPDDVELALHALDDYRIANQIHVARDGAEALAFLFAQGTHADRAESPLPRLVLLDLKLPRIDGLGVLQQLRAHPRTQRLPVVMMTSSREEQDLVRSYALGVNSYIVKPVDFDQFTQAMRTIGFYWLLLNEPPAPPSVPPAQP